MKAFFTKKHIIVSIITTVVISFLLQHSDIAYAQTVTVSTSTESLSEMVFKILWTILNILYMITLPILVIAGKAMDNSMIYGEFINLDKPLYMLHNLSKTFANFAIGWVLLRHILKYIFTDWAWKSPDILKKIIFKWIAIVLWVNASWFVLWALFDLSTIATYSLWAMPLGILKEINKDKDMPILSVMSYFDFQSQQSAADQWLEKKLDQSIYYQWGNINIPECDNLHRNGIVVWPKHFPNIPNRTWATDPNFSKWIEQKQYCALNTQTLVDITALEKRKTENIWSYNTLNNNDRNEAINNIIDKVNGWNCWNIDDLQVNWNPINIDQSNISDLFTNWLVLADGQKQSQVYCSWSNTMSITRNAYNEKDRKTGFMQGWNITPYNSQNGLTLNTILDRSKWMVGPFITLYMTLLDYSNLSITDGNNSTISSEVWWLMEFILKWAISIALFIPLVALALVLIIRVIILRWVIAFIPLWIVIYGLKDEIPWAEWISWWIDLWSNLWWKLDAKGIIWLIFAPILPVFAISISIIVLQTLQIELWHVMNDTSAVWSFFGMTSSQWTTLWTTCIDFRWLQQICFDTWNEVSSWSGFANFMPWLFLNIFGIWLMWMMIKMALSGSKIWASIWAKVMDLWKQALWAIPLISLWGKWVWANTLLKAPDMVLETATRKYDIANREQEDALYNKMMWTTPVKEETSNSVSNFTLTKPKETQQTYNNTIGKTTTPLTAWTYLEKFWEAIKSNEWEEQQKAFNNLSSNIWAQTEAFFNNIDEEQKKNLKKVEFIKHEIEKFINKNWDIITNNQRINELISYLNNNKETINPRTILEKDEVLEKFKDKIIRNEKDKIFNLKQ